MMAEQFCHSVVRGVICRYYVLGDEFKKQCIRVKILTYLVRCGLLQRATVKESYKIVLKMIFKICITPQNILLDPLIPFSSPLKKWCYTYF
jgi:hypothetical protein